MLQRVVPAAETREVVGGGRAALRRVDRMVQVAPVRRHPAPGEAAGPIPHPRQAAQLLARPVAVDAEHGTGRAVDAYPVPSLRRTGEIARSRRIDGPVADELADGFAGIADGIARAANGVARAAGGVSADHGSRIDDDAGVLGGDLAPLQRREDLPVLMRQAVREAHLLLDAVLALSERRRELCPERPVGELPPGRRRRCVDDRAENRADEQQARHIGAPAPALERAGRLARAAADRARARERMGGI